jgi:hypothetical protein
LSLISKLILSSALKFLKYLDIFSNLIVTTLITLLF